MTSAPEPGELDRRIAAARQAAVGGTGESLLALARILRAGYRQDGRVGARQRVTATRMAVVDRAEIHVIGIGPTVIIDRNVEPVSAARPTSD